ncbi:MAG: ATP-binding protein [Chloroflexota bacterium]
MNFVGRRKELNTLSRFLASQRAELLILYGRRRIGKTRLVTTFIEQNSETPALYWMATTHNERFQLRDFSQTIWRHDSRFNDEPAIDFTFSSWEEALSHLAEIVENSGVSHLVVLDEFTYLLRNEPAISSIFQKAWDHHLSKIPQLKLILTGSHIGMMAREVFSYQAPLYGRATSQIYLRPLPYAALIDLFPDRDAAERVAIFSVTGGVPAYLALFTRTSRFTTALRDECLADGSMMLSDPAVIIYEQLKEPQTYESILSAIASGFHTWADIAKMVGLAETALGHYLGLLQELELIEKRVPVLAKPRSKKGRYYVKDHFLRFYYRFIVPQRGSIERGYQEAATNKIWSELRGFIGEHIFEELCREWVWAAAMSGRLDFVPEQVGSYWRRYRGKGVQLDVVAAAPREKRLLIGEAKWGVGDLSRHILTDLVKRSQRMPQVEDGWQTEYLLFAREGFSDATEAYAQELGAILVSLERLEKDLIG